MKYYRVVNVMMLAALIAVSGIAQQAAPAKASVKISDYSISVNYSPPSMSGRKIFGGVVPYGEVWSIPAEFHTDADLVYKGGIIPKGDYTLYALVGTDEWQLIVSEATGAQTASYDSGMDVARAPMTVSKSQAPVETCKITLTPVAEFGARLELAWENTVAAVPLYLDISPGDAEW